MKGRLLEDYNSIINDYSYKKGQIVELTELESFHSSYAIYYLDSIDWIPKNLIKFN